MNAQHLALGRRKRLAKLLRGDDLREGVITVLKAGWSPRQIAGRMRHEGGRRRVCHETIYRYVYSPEGQAQELGRYLPERRRKRKARYARKPRSLVFPERCMIRNRPQAVKDREAFGHWEADLMIFRKEHGPANVAAVVERISRHTVIFRNNDRRSKPLMDNLINLLSPLPRHARQSLTFDRGLEFVSWRELEKGLGAQAWFCDPQAPWEKPTVENTNRRVRRWRPRETVLLTINQKELVGLGAADERHAPQMPGLQDAGRGLPRRAGEGVRCPIASAMRNGADPRCNRSPMACASAKVAQELQAVIPARSPA